MHWSSAAQESKRRPYHTYWVTYFFGDMYYTYIRWGVSNDEGWIHHHAKNNEASALHVVRLFYILQYFWQLFRVTIISGHFIVVLLYRTSYVFLVLVALSANLEKMLYFSMYRKVASSRPVYYSIFNHFWGATNWDVLLTEMCYYCHVQQSKAKNSIW